MNPLRWLEAWIFSWVIWLSEAEARKLARGRK